MFTLEIGERPIAVINVPNREDAEDLLKDEEFLEDLAVLRSGGSPLWDRQAGMSLREATGDEREEFERSLADDLAAAEEAPDGEEPGFVMFLVDVAEPGEEEGPG